MFFAKIKLFFVGNRDIEWSRRKIGLTLAATLLSGSILGQMAISWLYPEAFAYSFTVTAREKMATVPEEEPVDSNEWDPCGLRDVVCPDEKPETIEEKIKSVFSEDPLVAVAVMKSESGLVPNQVGWNCEYIGENGKPYSTSCKVEDRKKAWSVDCGLAQINVPGKVCPKELFDVDHNLKVARKKYEKANGFFDWVGFTSGRYKKYL